MATVIRSLMTSPLADRYHLELVATHTGPGARRRFTVFATAVARLAWWSLRGRGRIVHVHATVRGSLYRKAVCVLVAKALGRRVILHMHSGPADIASMRDRLGDLGVRLFRWIFRFADLVLAVSEASAAALERVFGIEGIRIVPNVAPEEPMTYARKYDGPPTLLYLGGFANPVKGGSDLLEALAQPNLRDLPVVLAGPGEAPPSIDALTAAGQPVQWCGWLDQAARNELLRDAGIFVLPSISEGLPMALLEAMAYALPIVATTVGGVPGVVTDRREALLVPPGEPEQLAKALERVASDAQLRESLGTGARRRARDLNAEEVTTLQVIYADLAP